MDSGGSPEAGALRALIQAPESAMWPMNGTVRIIWRPQRSASRSAGGILIFQEACFLGDDKLDIHGCVGYGRNRTRVENNAPHRSGGVGFLVVEEATKHTKITVESPTYGDYESLLALRSSLFIARRKGKKW